MTRTPTSTRASAHDHIPMRLLEELAAALSKLEKVAGEAARASSAHGSILAVMRLREMSSDIVAIGRRYLMAQQAASEAISDWAEQMRVVSPGAGEWIIVSDDQWPELGELRVLWKAWFIFVRALCDNAYTLLLAHAESKPARVGGSMAAALRTPENPVARILAAEDPTFLSWFQRQRDRRNDVKQGVALTCTALHSPGVAITFDEYRYDAESGRLSRLVNSDRNRVTLTDVVTDVAQLTRLLEIVRATYERGR